MPGIPRFSGGAVGYFSYDAVRLREAIPDKNPKNDPADDIFFGFYRDVIAFDNKEHRLLLVTNMFLEGDGSVENAYKDALYRLGTMEDRMAVRLQASHISVRQKTEPVSNFSQEEFEAAVEKCREYIRAGDIFQVVPSQRFTVRVEADPFDLYRILRVVNPSPYMYYLAIDGTSVIGASPEMLVGWKTGTRGAADRGHASRGARPVPKMKSSWTSFLPIPRSGPSTSCSLISAATMWDGCRRTGSVRVEEMMHIEKYSHVIHIVSNVRGDLPEGSDAFDALFSCFPAGTLSGAPKIRAMEIIDELEPVKRGHLRRGARLYRLERHHGYLHCDPHHRVP